MYPTQLLQQKSLTDVISKPDFCRKLHLFSIPVYQEKAASFGQDTQIKQGTGHMDGTYWEVKAIKILSFSSTSTSSHHDGFGYTMNLR